MGGCIGGCLKGCLKGCVEGYICLTEGVVVEGVPHAILHAQAWEITQRYVWLTGVITPLLNPPGGLRRGVIPLVSTTPRWVISHALACISMGNHPACCGAYRGYDTPSQPPRGVEKGCDNPGKPYTSLSDLPWPGMHFHGKSASEVCCLPGL